MRNKILLFFAITISMYSSAQVGIGTSNPNANAVLDITSTTKGLLPPRMTENQRNAITSPSQGLIIFCTNCALGEGELQIRLTSGWKNLMGGYASNYVQPRVGDFYQGGVVFYIFTAADTGYIAGETHGLIAAVADQSSGIRWYNGSNVDTPTATAIGTGSANTDAIIAIQGATETSYAAGLARAYRGGGYTDWFLPSKDELSKMQLNKTIINTTAGNNGGNNFTSAAPFWSSSQGGYDRNAWINVFNDGRQAEYDKYQTFYVRAVRTF